jgi:TM2 domain-containing membrane protein YozV
MPETPRKKKSTALILAFFNLDRFYTGYTGLGILKFLTGGCCGILWIIDMYRIATDRMLDANGNPLVK